MAIFYVFVISLINPAFSKGIHAMIGFMEIVIQVELLMVAVTISLM